MFTKVEQHSWIKIKVSLGHSTHECFQGLCEALRRKQWHLVVQNPMILHDNARSHTIASVTDLLHQWQWEILEYPPYSSNMSPCDYNLFTKVKEPLRGTRYNTRDELIHAIGRCICDINKDGRADSVRRLPNIWQKARNKEATVLKIYKCCISVNTAMLEISNCCHYFLSNPRMSTSETCEINKRSIW